jgi:GTP pyrophosphokinase
MAPERLIDAQWGQADGGAFPVDIEVLANDRTGLLRDISDMLARERINVLAANTGTRDAAARMGFTLEVTDLAQLARVLGLIAQVPGVTSARRK